MFFVCWRLYGMEKSGQKIREEIMQEYGDKSTFKLLCVILVASVAGALNSEVSIFVISYLSTILIPFILWQLIGFTDLFLLSLLIAIPIHFVMYNYMSELREIIEDKERIRLLEKLKVEIGEIKSLIKNRKN
ncbi:MAG: hypothetical protein RIT43_1494 [Bacteroidota bacterium]|jgi:hypothetical protein